MHWIKILIVIIASAWFFPVSCTVSLLAGTQLIAKLDARDVSKGESVHSKFSVVVEPGENGNPFRVVSSAELPELKKQMTLSGTASNNSFLMSEPVGNLKLQQSGFSYQVIEATGNEQIIEVIESYHDGDNTIWSHYKATQSNIFPISSRMFYFGYMFQAIPYAFGLALLLYILGRILKRRSRASMLNE